MKINYNTLCLDPDEVFNPYLVTPSYKAANGTIGIKDGDSLTTYRQDKIDGRVYIVGNRFNLSDGGTSIEKALANALDMSMENERAV